ncbi:MAG: ABC transporter substrate-binding protein [Cyanobacteria bacterium J06648_11]
MSGRSRFLAASLTVSALVFGAASAFRIQANELEHSSTGIPDSAIASSDVACDDTGGTMVMTWKDDVATLDPAIGYDWQNWSMIKSLFSRLLDYEPGTTNLIPSLAESYEVSDSGTIYTFSLRSGVKFHNGREMTADDVKYSLERTIAPATKSPAQGFYNNVLGFDEFTAGEADELEGVRVVDATTVEIELQEPDAAFLHIIALNFSSVVPQEEVEKYGEDFGKNPVGTGAFQFDSWNLGQRLVFARNPDYMDSCIPKLDRIEFEVGQEPTVALLRLERGEVDLLGDGLPPSRFVDFTQNSSNEDLVKRGTQLQTGYIAINTRIEPFTDMKVRQALNMAINKERIVQLINGRAEVANQILPPSMPGYDPNYEGFDFDPEGAKALLTEAGFPDGFSTQLFVNNTDPNPRIAQSIQKDLSAIGIDLELKTQAQSTVIAAGGEEDGAPLVWSGGMAWIADYPDPSNFYWPILSCDAISPGTWNWAWYCNESLDAMAKEADTLTGEERAEERNELYRSLFVQAMEEAPWVPIFNEQRVTVHSADLTGDESLWLDPVRIPVNYDHIQAAQ